MTAILAPGTEMVYPSADSEPLAKTSLHVEDWNLLEADNFDIRKGKPDCTRHESSQNHLLESAHR